MFEEINDLGPISVCIVMLANRCSGYNIEICIEVFVWQEQRTFLIKSEDDSRIRQISIISAEP